MNPVSVPSDHITTNEGKGRRRAEQIEEAQEIHRWLIFQRKFAGDVIRRSMKLIKDKEEAATARLDLSMIARHLARAAAAETWDAIWKDYQRHFIGDKNRQLFFSKLQRVTRRIASILLARDWEMERERNANVEADLQWDESLLPKSIAPWVVRLATLHPGVLEDFLPRFFVHASDCLLQGSTYRRAMLIQQAVGDFGWSAEKHTRRLVVLGEIRPSEDGSEVETVKKFIRDLRRRHRKRLSLTRQTEPIQGTSSARKAAA
jgi:hypothetical protein